MMPMTFPDKRAALTGAFLNRLSIGVAIGAGVAGIAWPGWAVGLMFGVLISAAEMQSSRKLTRLSLELGP